MDTGYIFEQKWLSQSSELTCWCTLKPAAFIYQSGQTWDCFASVFEGVCLCVCVCVDLLRPCLHFTLRSVLGSRIPDTCSNFALASPVVTYDCNSFAHLLCKHQPAHHLCRFSRCWRSVFMGLLLREIHQCDPIPQGLFTNFTMSFKEKKRGRKAAKKCCRLLIIRWVFLHAVCSEAACSTDGWRQVSHMLID